MGEAEVEISEGVVSLEWKGEGGEVELLHRRPDQPDLIRKITGDQKTVVTGMDEGVHEFRLRVPGGDWGGVMTVTNTFMDRKQVVWLLFSGGLVVAFIVGGILTGMRNGKEES